MKRAIGPLVAVMVWTSAPSASAFCRMTIDDTFQPSLAQPCDDVSAPLFWGRRCTTFSVQKDASSRVSLDQASSIAQRAFDRWAEVDCLAVGDSCSAKAVGKPSIRVTRTEPVACGCVEFEFERRNANVIVFRDEDWVGCDGTPLRDKALTIALTTVQYDWTTGQIFGADLEINSAVQRITVGETRVAFDLESILTHEAGHFLGIAHTEPQNTGSTMYSDYVARRTSMRTLEDDDRCAVCTVYPPAAEVSCDGALSDEFAGECIAEQADCGCRWVGRGGRSNGFAVVVGGVWLACVGGRRRRRR